MPSVFSHYLFAEKAIDTLPEGLITTDEERQAFFIGTHGPDPLCICHTTTLKRGFTVRHLSRDIHHAHMTRNLMCMREGVGHLDPEVQGIGRAYVLGFLAHWLLDSMVHPFVFAQQNEICALDESLKKSPGEVHATIESDIDSWFLWITHRVTVEDFTIDDITKHTDRVERVMSELVAYSAQNVFGTTVPPAEIAGSLKDFIRVFRAIDPVGTPRSKVLSRIELLFRPNSRVLGQGHAIWTSDECPAANLEHRLWSNAASGITSTDSFLDLFYAALERYPKLAEMLVRGDEDELRAEIAGRNYVGLLVEDV